MGWQLCRSIYSLGLYKDVDWNGGGGCKGVAMQRGFHRADPGWFRPYAGTQCEMMNTKTTSTDRKSSVFITKPMRSISNEQARFAHCT